MNNLVKPKSHNSVRVVVVTTQEQLLHAFYVRSMTFMEGEKLKLRQAFDGNDFQATHMVAYDSDEPIGSTRIRWFRDFAKIERTSFRSDYRDPRLLRHLARTVFDHVARKGYGKLITHASPELVPVWRRFLGFRVVDKEPLTSIDYPDCVEMVRDLDVHDDAVTIDSDIRRLLRVEGEWDTPTWLG